MIDRFQGSSGRAALVTALQRQSLVGHSSKVAEAIADGCTLVEYEVDELIIEQGGDDADIVFILAGDTSIWVNRRRVATRSAGSHVGEMVAIDPTALRSADVVASKKTVVARLAGPRFMTIANDHPVIWRHLSNELADRLRQRERFQHQPNERPYLFVGSSAEQLAVAREIQNQLRHDPVTVKLWSDGVFGASIATMTALVEETQRADFAVFVMNPDDVVRSRGSQATAPRDNVILELGMFIGALGLKRVMGVHARTDKFKVPSDLLGVGLLDYESTGDLTADLGPSINAIRERLKDGPA